MAKNTKLKYSIYIFGIDSPKTRQGTSGFSAFLIEVIKEVNLILGDFYFSSSKDIIRIYLILDSSEPEYFETIKTQERNEINYLSSSKTKILALA